MSASDELDPLRIAGPDGAVLAGPRPDGQWGLEVLSLTEAGARLGVLVERCRIVLTGGPTQRGDLVPVGQLRPEYVQR